MVIYNVYNKTMKDGEKMNCLELKGARARKGVSKKEIAALIGKTPTSYYQKEHGKIPFFPAEMLAIAVRLELDADQFNCIFFDGKLPFRKSTAS